MDLDERRLLRKEILRARDHITSLDRQKNSERIRKNLWQVDRFARAGVVMLYVSFRSEVETLPLIKQCMDIGKKVGVPLTVVGDGRIVPCLLEDVDQDLKPGYCGILEPDPSRVRALAAKAIESVVVPGGVFDRLGGRLGYGGGYYDRFLADDVPHATRIGLAFERQLVEAVPLLSHDQRMHFVVTENEIITVKE